MAPMLRFPHVSVVLCILDLLGGFVYRGAKMVEPWACQNLQVAFDERRTGWSQYETTLPHGEDTTNFF